MNKLKAIKKKETNIKKSLKERNLNSNTMLESERLKCRKNQKRKALKRARTNTKAWK